MSLRVRAFGEFPQSGSVGAVIYHTTTATPGRLTLTGLNLEDSLVAGTFDFTVVADSNPSLTRTFTGSFRAAIAPVFTTENPDGTPCTVPH